MKKQTLPVLLLCVCMLLTSFAGCGADNTQSTNTGSSKDTAQQSSQGEGQDVSNLNQEGFPIVNEEITLRVFGQQGPVQGKWDDMSLWKTYQEMTNIKLDFTDVLPAEGFDEKKSLMWASNEYPDIFVRSMISNTDLVKYGSMGVLAPLEDLIENYAPNMKKLIDENPAILSRITAPDGHIYSLPAVFTLNAARCEKFWINTKWLEQANKEVPATMDELEDVLKAFQGVDFNGNGQQDEYPMGAADANTIIRRMVGVWGHQVQFGQYLEVSDGTVSSYLTDDSFKEVLQWIHDMYAQGLIDPEVFTQEYAKYAGKMAAQQMGLFFNQADDTFDSADFIGISPFTGKADVQYAEAQPVARDNGVFAISMNCENKEAAMRWIDYFYSEEGSIMMRYGVEGENMYFDEEGLPRYNDGILNSPEGSGTEIGKFTIWPGGGAPQWVNETNCEAIASQATLDAEVALHDYFPKDIYAEPMLSQEVSDRLGVLQTDLENYRKETTAKFIRGELSLETDWSTYVDTMEKIGLAEWVSIYQQALDNVQQ